MSLKQNKDVVRRKPFDLQEAVILLDVYISYIEKGASNIEASEVASYRLRSLALSRGMNIDISFRSVAGIQNRLRSIGHIFNGEESTSTQGSQVFREAVYLYNNDFEHYGELLRGDLNDRDTLTKRKSSSSIYKTKFVKTRKDQNIKAIYGEDFKNVYYALKRSSNKKDSGITATDLFHLLGKRVKRKDIMFILKEASWAKRITESHYAFFDKELEERKKKQMDNLIKATEQEFFLWLSSAVSPSDVREIKKAYSAICTMLIKKKAIPKSLFAITKIGQVKDALSFSKKIFSNKKTRNTSRKLLTAYITYLREQKSIGSHEELTQEIDVQENWIRFAFTNSKQFEYTVPAYVSINGNKFDGRNWARILVGIAEQELKNNNPALEDLYKQSLIANRNGHPFFLKEKLEGLNCSKLSNGYWINLNYSIPRLLDQIWALCLCCGYNKPDVVIYGVDKKFANSKAKSTVLQASGNGINLEKVEDFLRSEGLHGATLQNLIDKVQPDAAVNPTKNILNKSSSIILMPGNRYVHVDSFVDLDEAEEEMERILKTHFVQFGGYSNSKLLFGAASHEMSMFLNDNACESVDSVYALAQYFFFKKRKENAYTFSYPHIFEKKPDYPLTLKGLMINLARVNGGVLVSEEAKIYLQKTMLSYGSLVQLLQISSTDTFLYYDEKRFLLSESIGERKALIQSVHNQLVDLFQEADIAYVIPRDITVSWLSTLPALPQGVPWTILLLQEVLRNNPEIGFRPITSELGQASDTIAAAFVPINSSLQSFADVVTLYMQEKYPLPKRMTGEELRRDLREAGMLEGNELIYALPKALDDYRFNWTDGNKMVLVRGN